MGDVILSEPIAAALKDQEHQVDLCTAYEHVGNLLDSYDRVIPYSRFQNHDLLGYDVVHELRYEIFPGFHHLDGFATDIGVRLTRRVPVFKVRFPRLGEGPYGLIAPHTSAWIQKMRTWPFERFEQLMERLSAESGLPWIMLKPEDSFERMLSLIGHAQFFIGNDSGPSIIAQSFDVPAIVLFGATREDLVLFGSRAHGIFSPVGCNGCKHFTRYTDIKCVQPLCLESLTVNHVCGEVLRILRELN